MFGFGIKDLFTTINLLGGVIAICLCVAGEPFYAGVSVMLGYFCGDTVDGWIARKLGTSNQFGGEYDTISDHLSHVVAPAAIVYTVYADPKKVDLVPAPWNQVLAIALAASMIVSVSIRHARNIVAPIHVKGVWAGLPRSVLGFWAIGYVNATLAPYAPGGWWLGVALIPLMSLATLTYLPFPSHRIARRHRLGFYVVAFSSFGAMFAALAFAPKFFFDVVFFCMAGYSASAWMTLTKDELIHYHQVVAETKQQLRAAARPAG
jgi:phosphatidylserine synthase